MWADNQKNCAVILAAGEGKRMKSNRPKVLSPVLFKPMLRWVMDAVLDAGVPDLCVVAGFRHEDVEDYLAEVCLEGLDMNLTVALQKERKGTAHAVQMADAFLQKFRGGNVLVLNGDAPFLDASIIHDALEHHIKSENAVTVIAAELENPTGYGRIVRDQTTNLLHAIVEQKDADEPTRNIREVNSGAYWFHVDDLLSVLYRIDNRNAQGEYYLPDAIRLLLDDGRRADAFVTENADTVRGANDCMQLHDLNAIARDKILREHMQKGTDIPCRDGILIGPDVRIGAHSSILPGTILRGHTHIGEECIIGANTCLTDVTVGKGITLNAVHAQNCTITETPSPFTVLGQPRTGHHHA